MMICNNGIDLAEIRGWQIARNRILNGCSCIAVFHCLLAVHIMCQQAIQGTGDISITTADTVYYINVLISRLLNEAVSDRIIDAGTEGMNLRRMYDTLPLH